jgi:hypothetical protein
VADKRSDPPKRVVAKPDFGSRRPPSMRARDAHLGHALQQPSEAATSPAQPATSAARAPDYTVYSMVSLDSGWKESWQTKMLKTTTASGRRKPSRQ